MDLLTYCFSILALAGASYFATIFFGKGQTIKVRNLRTGIIAAIIAGFTVFIACTCDTQKFVPMVLGFLLPTSIAFLVALYQEQRESEKTASVERDSRLDRFNGGV